MPTPPAAHGFQNRVAFSQVLRLQPPHRGGPPANGRLHLIGGESQRGPQPQALNPLQLRFASSLLQRLGQPL